MGEVRRQFRRAVRALRGGPRSLATARPGYPGRTLTWRRADRGREAPTFALPALQRNPTFAGQLLSATATPPDPSLPGTARRSCDPARTTARKRTLAWMRGWAGSTPNRTYQRSWQSPLGTGTGLWGPRGRCSLRSIGRMRVRKSSAPNVLANRNDGMQLF